MKSQNDITRGGNIMYESIQIRFIAVVVIENFFTWRPTLHCIDILDGCLMTISCFLDLDSDFF